MRYRTVGKTVLGIFCPDPRSQDLLNHSHWHLWNSSRQLGGVAAAARSWSPCCAGERRGAAAQSTQTGSRRSRRADPTVPPHRCTLHWLKRTIACVCDIVDVTGGRCSSIHLFQLPLSTNGNKWSYLRNHEVDWRVFLSIRMTSSRGQI